MVGGPEVSRAVKQFKSHCCLAGTKYEENHHEEYDSYRSRFNNHVNKLVCSFRDKGNPFLYSSENDTFCTPWILERLFSGLKLKYYLV